MNYKTFKKSCENTRVLLIGDVMLDRYVFGKVNRISPEAPVPVFLTENKKEVLGGAGNVFNNLVSLGVNVSFITAVGNDDIGKNIKKCFSYFKNVKKFVYTQKKKFLQLRRDT